MLSPGRLGVQRKRRLFSLRPLLEWVPPDDGYVGEGVADPPVIETGVAATKQCDKQSYWTITETADGINVQFTFKIRGKSKKVRIKGRWEGSSGEILSVQAWNGSSWDEITTIEENTEDQTYTVDLSDQYTIDGETRVRVYRAAGTNNVLYLDCIHILALGDDSGIEETLNYILDSESNYLRDENKDYLIEGGESFPPSIKGGTTTTIIAPSAGEWYGRADMVELHDGNWIMTYLEKSSHTSTDGVLKLRFSNDYGATWTAEDTYIGGGGLTNWTGYMTGAAPGDGLEPGTPSFIVAPNGDIILAAQRADYVTPTISGLWINISSDGGESWSGWSRITFGGVTDQDNVGLGHGFIRNNILYSIGQGDGYRIIYSSSDNGVTWSLFEQIVDESATDVGAETALVWFGGPNLLVIHRSDNNDKTLKQVSDDFGDTWISLEEIQSDIGVLGKPEIQTRDRSKGLVNWQDDNVLIMTGFIFPDPGNSHPRHIAAWLSEDYGVNWEGPFLFDDVCYDGGYGSRALYDPANDEFVFVTYHGPDYDPALTEASIKQYRFTLYGAE